MKLSTKLSLIIVLIILGCGVATSLLVSSYTQKILEKKILDDVDIIVDSLAPQLSESLINEDLVVDREILKGILSKTRGLDFAYINNMDGKILAHTFGKELPNQLPDKQALKPKVDGNRSPVRFDYKGSSYLVAGHPLLEGVDLGNVFVGINQSVFEADIRKLNILIFSISFSVAITGMLVAVSAASRVTRPLKLLTGSISDYAAGNTTFPIIATGGLEIKELGTAFHKMIKSRNEADDALRKSEEKHRLLFENAGDAIYIHNTEGRFLSVNPLACNQLGYSHDELMSLPLANLDTPEESRLVPERFARLMSEGEFTFETVHLCKDGSSFPVEANARVITWDGQPAIMSICRDITERKLAEEEHRNMELQMQQTQKLESLGVLAGGIAHDFNNILMAIMGNADLALMRINPESPAVDNLQRIEKSAERAADLAKQMLAYSGKGKYVVERIDISRLVEEMHHMMEVSISKKAVFRFNLTSPIPSVKADATQLRQIIMNLVINASEAIGDKSGVIAITTGCMECDKNYLTSVWLKDNLNDGLYVSLEVSDTGCGMDSETLSKLFDPFFTTKFTGRGLGMAAVLGIVRGHHGAIRVYSEPGKGSSFKILLPAVDRPAEIFDGQTQTDDWKGNGTVLLVDDEETVRAIGCDMLRELGFEVITAEDGRDAIEVFKTRNDIAFVILDLTMPHMDGEQCFHELKQLKPDIKVIMSSGFNQHEVTQKFAGKGLAGFIQKPYRLSVFQEVIRVI